MQTGPTSLPPARATTAHHATSSGPLKLRQERKRRGRVRGRHGLCRWLIWKAGAWLRWRLWQAVALLTVVLLTVCVRLAIVQRLPVALLLPIILCLPTRRRRLLPIILCLSIAVRRHLPIASWRPVSIAVRLLTWRCRCLPRRQSIVLVPMSVHFGHRVGVFEAEEFRCHPCDAALVMVAFVDRPCRGLLVLFLAGDGREQIRRDVG